MYISQLIGQGEYKRLNKTIGSVFTLVALLGVFMTFIGFICSGLGLKGFFLGYFIAPYFTAVPAMLYYYSGIWKKRKLLT